LGRPNACVKEKNETKCSFKSQSRPFAKRIGISVLLIKEETKKIPFLRMQEAQGVFFPNFSANQKFVQTKKKKKFWT